MGIDGLHSIIKPYCVPSHVGDLSGHRVGVDAWSWLHRGAVGAARDLALGQQPWVERGYDAPWVEFILKMCRVLEAANVTPVLVFDGCRLPAKAATNQQRRKRRQEAKEKARRLLQEGREQEAQAAFMQCVDVTPDMAHDVMLRLRQHGIQFVVAPYEADAQLAYLSSLPEREGGVAAVITEDSDLVAYGCRRVLFKMDGAGNCLELSLDRLLAGPEGAAEAPALGDGSRGGKAGGGVLSLRGWSLEMLQAACVLAGCDFLASIKGISFRTAAGFVARRRSLAGALKAIRLEKRFQLAATEQYCAAAERAALAFKHALVFCANTAGGSCRRLNPMPERGAAPADGRGCTAQAGGLDLSQLGAELDADVARGIAYGYLHPHTFQPFPAAAAGAAQMGSDRLGGAGRQHHGRSQQQQQQPQQQPQQHPQQLRPTISGRRREPGSWMASGAAGRPGQHGLGPTRPAAPLPPATQQHRQQQHWRGADLSDELHLHALRGQAGAHQQTGQQAVHLPPPPHGPGAQQQAASPAAAREGGWPGVQRGQAVQQCERQPMQPITNLASQALSQSQQQSSATAFCPSPADPAGTPSQQQQQSVAVWNSDEQYRRHSPAPAATGAKRKSSGGGGSTKKAACKPLAPPSQRISRFFQPASRP